MRAPGFIDGPREGNLLRVVAVCDGLDRCLECPDRVDDFSKRQEAQCARKSQGNTDRDQCVSFRVPDHRDGSLACIGRELFVVINPILRDLAEARADRSHRSEQYFDAVFPELCGRQRHDLLVTGEPFAAKVAILVEQPSVPVIRDESVGVLSKQAGQVRPVRGKVRLDPEQFRLVFSQHIASKINPQLREALGDVPQRRETSDLGFRNEAAASFDDCQLDPDNDADAHEGQERNGEQDDQAFCDRHGFFSQPCVEQKVTGRAGRATWGRNEDTPSAPWVKRCPALPRYSAGSRISTPSGARTEAMRSSTE